MQLEIAQSTPTAASIAQLVGPQYAFGPVVASEFLRRSFNQVYRLDFANGRRTIARYRGVASAYTLDCDDLLLQPLQNLLKASTMTAALGRQFEELGARLHRRILALGPLAQVLCHGDAHGSNNFVLPAEQGERMAVFFDFDDSGPGYLAYELAVYPWSLYPRTPDGAPSAKVLTQWQQFIRAYRAARAMADVDLAAIAPFMAVRQFWLLGEYAGRVPVWGSQARPTDYLRRQVDVLRQWETLQLAP